MANLTVLQVANLRTVDRHLKYPGKLRRVSPWRLDYYELHSSFPAVACCGPAGGAVGGGGASTAITTDEYIEKELFAERAMSLFARNRQLGKSIPAETSWQGGY
jgi:hypothetical protein